MTFRLILFFSIIVGWTGSQNLTTTEENLPILSSTESIFSSSLPSSSNPCSQNPPLEIEQTSLASSQSTSQPPESQNPNRAFVAVRDTVFRLFSRSSGRLGEIIKLGNVESINQTSFNRLVPTRFIIHDWMNEGFSGSTNSIRDAYLEVGNYNVIVVDWSAGSIGSYLTVTDLAPSVGYVLAQFIDFMNSEGGLDFEQIYVVGYGLGAHIAGVAGKSVTQGRLPVIFGLDPIHLRIRDSSSFYNILTHSDANYVEVIHTSILTTRLMRPAGHADFYVSYGSSQPGCFLNPVSCSHERAYKYFVESIKSQVGFYGLPCNDFRDIVWRRSCRRNSGLLARMGGEFAQSARWGLYVVKVNSSPPFALGLIE